MATNCRMLIDGRWVDATGRSHIEVIDPATEDVVGTVPVATAPDLDTAFAPRCRGGGAGAAQMSGHAAGS
jgi:acyl-CoA reductase-like NAD-dependent aldehyde dehydrogenase